MPEVTICYNYQRNELNNQNMYQVLLLNRILMTFKDDQFILHILLMKNSWLHLCYNIKEILRVAFKFTKLLIASAISQVLCIAYKAWGARKLGCTGIYRREPGSALKLFLIQKRKFGQIHQWNIILF